MNEFEDISRLLAVEEGQSTAPVALWKVVRSVVLHEQA
jgi:hypothetical protein